MFEWEEILSPRALLFIVLSLALGWSALHENPLREGIRVWLEKFFAGTNPSFERISKAERWAGRLSSGLLIGAAVLLAVLQIVPEPVEWDPMPGTNRVAVSPFVMIGKGPRKSLGEEVARTSLLQIQADLSKITPPPTVWGPDELKERKIHPVTGTQPEARSDSALELAELIHADVVVYGTVELRDSALYVSPQFYIRSENYADAEEIAGPHELGSPIVIPNYSDSIYDREQISARLSARVQALSRVVRGLSYYSKHDFATAQEAFQGASEIPGWEADEGKQVIYLFLANAAIRPQQPDLEAAEEFYRRALEIEPEYARGLVGLANVYYRRALQPAILENKPEKVDRALIHQALELLERAEKSPHQLPQADIATKAAFERGQCYFALAYGGFAKSYDQAVSEFRRVIADYDEGANLRVQERAAEAHARLGLIFQLSGDEAGAKIEYETAAHLLERYPERQAQYLQRAQALSAEPSK